MALQTIEITKEFPFSVEKLFAYLGEHENLSVIFAPARIKRLTSGKDTRNGVGSAREVRVLLAPPLVETVTAYRENELIEYRITKGGPLKNHVGTMRFSSTAAGGAKLHYTIVFEGKFPLVASVLRPGLELAIRRGLAGLRL